MDKDQVGGKFDQAVGKVKEKVGDTFGNQKLANEGVADQVKGSAKETWGNVKDAAHVSSDRKEHDVADTSTEHRSSFSDKVTEMKNKVNEKIDDYKDRERAKDTNRS